MFRDFPQIQGVGFIAAFREFLRDRLNALMLQAMTVKGDKMLNG